MAQILSFPSQEAQGLAYLDRQLRELMESKGADVALIDFAAQHLTSIYSQLTDAEQYSFAVQLPEGLSQEDSHSLSEQINSGLSGLRKENHSTLVRLIAQLVLAEVKLFQHERED